MISSPVPEDILKHLKTANHSSKQKQPAELFFEVRASTILCALMRYRCCCKDPDIMFVFSFVFYCLVLFASHVFTHFPALETFIMVENGLNQGEYILPETFTNYTPLAIMFSSEPAVLQATLIVAADIDAACCIPYSDRQC
jgi:hypothetical protein